MRRDGSEIAAHLEETGVPRSARELTSAIASGDTEAFAAFYRERFDMMFREAHRCTGRDESFCLDVVQDSMMRVIRSIKPLDDESQLIAWLKVIVRHCAYDHLRRESRRRRRESTACPSASGPSDLGDLPQRLEWLRRQIDELDPEQSMLLSLRFRLGWTLQQIGIVLGLKPGAVDGRLNRTITALRQSALEEFHE